MRYPPDPADSLPCAEYRARMRERLADSSYFQASVAWWGVDGMKDLSAAARTISRAWPTIELLFDAADSCLAFGDERLALRFPTKEPATHDTGWPAWATPRPRGAAGRTLALREARASADFMAIALARGVVPVFALDAERLDVDGLMRRVSDPTQVNPPFGILPDAGKRVARKAISARSPQALLTRNAYGLDVQFHAPSDLITGWFDRALTIGRWTEGFEKAHCRHDVRPFEVGTTLLWEAVSRKRHGLEVAIEQLRAAERDPNADDRTTPHAMAAAELLAALAGRPPLVYTELEPDRNRRIGVWMDENREKFTITAADLALARRAVEAIVERSTLPDRRWRTLPPKTKWEQTMRELIGRLEAASPP